MQTDYEAMKQAVDDYLEEIGVRYSVVNAGVRTVQPEKPKGDPLFSAMLKPCEQDAWRVTFDAKQWNELGHKVRETKVQPYSTDYFTGSGHRILPRAPGPSGLALPSFKKDTDGKIVSAARATNSYDVRWQEKNAKLVLPRAADIIHCLLLDSSANDQSFHDWASDLGYDTDSIKALGIYNACCETARDLRTIFNHEQLAKLRELTEEM